MPIENIETVNQTSVVVSEQNPFFTNNVIIAGKIKVRHAMIDEPLLLVGFVIEDEYFNENDFKVLGMRIQYKLEDEEYNAQHEIIYPKIIIDRKTNHSNNYFKNENLIYRTRGDKEVGYYHEGQYYNSGSFKYESRINTFFRYYMIDDNSVSIPESAADNIMALCKYCKDGIFKYAIFNLHELTPVL